MATQAAKSGGGAENVDGGVIIGITAVDLAAKDSPNVIGKGLNELATGNEYGSKVVPIDTDTGGRVDGHPEFTDNVGIGAATAGVGTSMAFTPNPADRTATDPQFIIRGVSTTLAGSGNTVLQVLGSDYAGKAHDWVNETVSDRKIGTYSDTSIDVLEPTSSGIFPYRTKGSNAGDALAFVHPSGDGLSSGTAGAVTVADFDNRGTPGKLNFMAGGPTPTGQNYPAKDSFET
jgi:hypothetical protein